MDISVKRLGCDPGVWPPLMDPMPESWCDSGSSGKHQYQVDEPCPDWVHFSRSLIPGQLLAQSRSIFPIIFSATFEPQHCRCLVVQYVASWSQAWPIHPSRTDQFRWNVRNLACDPRRWIAGGCAIDVEQLNVRLRRSKALYNWM